MRSRFLMLTEIISDRISQSNGGSERNPYKSLAGRKISIAELHQELQQLGYGEIDWLENLGPLMASGVIIVAADDSGENQLEIDFAKVAVGIQYFPYTKGTSSTHLKRILNQLLKK